MIYIIKKFFLIGIIINIIGIFFIIKSIFFHFLLFHFLLINIMTFQLAKELFRVLIKTLLNFKKEKKNFQL